jgi:hypothetical protein
MTDWLLFFGGLALGWIIRAVLEFAARNRLGPYRMP